MLGRTSAEFVLLLTVIYPANYLCKHKVVSSYFSSPAEYYLFYFPHQFCFLPENHIVFNLEKGIGPALEKLSSKLFLLTKQWNF